MTKKQKKMLIRIIIAAVMLAALHFIPVTGWLRLALYLVTYVVIGYDIMKKAGQGILNGRVFDENFLMAVATIGAFALAIYEKSGDYNEAIAVMLFYQIGELFQSYAVGKSRKNISALMDIRPDYANIEQDGQLVQVDPDEVAIGTVIVVQPGEKVPIDGVITEGTLHPEHQRPHRREPASRRPGGRRDHQRLHQHDRPAEDPHHQGVRRVHRVQDPGAGGKLQLPQVPLRGLHRQVRPHLHPRGVLQRPGAGRRCRR